MLVYQRVNEIYLPVMLSMAWLKIHHWVPWCSYSVLAENNSGFPVAMFAGGYQWLMFRVPDNPNTRLGIWLVGGIPTPLKNMTSSVGMMTFPTEWNVVKFMFQTTNQMSFRGTSFLSISSVSRRENWYPARFFSLGIPRGGPIALIKRCSTLGIYNIYSVFVWKSLNIMFHLIELINSGT